MPDKYSFGQAYEISANTTNTQGLIGIWNLNVQRTIGTYPILEDPSNTFCQKYITPPTAVIGNNVNNYIWFPGVAAGNNHLNIVIGFRTPAIDTTNTKIMYLFDWYNWGYNAYIFFRANVKRLAFRYGTTDLFPQLDYDFQPETDYHMVFKVEQTKYEVFINGVSVVIGTVNSGGSMPTNMSIHLFGSVRWPEPVHTFSRFYYIYGIYNTPLYYENATEYAAYIQAPGFKDKFRIPTVTIPNPIPVVSPDMPFVPANSKVFGYTFAGQVTFNNVIKYKHPSTTVVQLLDPIAQTVLKTTMTNDDGSFVLRYDTYPKYSQLIAIDYSGEYNTQSLLLKTTS